MSPTQKTILVFSAYYLPGSKGGGPIKTIANLISNAPSDFYFYIVTNDHDLGETTPYQDIYPGCWNRSDNTQIFYLQPGAKFFFQILRIFKKKKVHVVYINSFFSPKFSLLPLLLAKTLRQQVVLGPRGEFSAGALNFKRRKKTLFLTLYKMLRLHKGVVFQASSQYEAKDIHRALGHSVDIKIAEDIASKEFVSETPGHERDSLKAVFVSRISPMKNLLGALDIIANSKYPLRYDIYGPIEDPSYWEQCQKKIKSLPENIQVNYQGELSPKEVIPTISQYDLFFMPTKGENYGHVIAEALCAGLPLLISDTTPWRNLEVKGIGWDLPLDRPHAFTDILHHVYQMATEEHATLRQRVLCWSKARFSQDDAIEANIAMFEYALQKRR